MAFVPLTNCAKVVMNYTVVDQPAINRMYFLRPGYTQSELQDLADSVDASVGAYMLPLQNAGVSYVNTLVRGMDNEFDLEAQANAQAGTGSAGAGAVTSQNSLAVQMQTGFTGRSARGRLFMLPGITSQLTNSRTANPTYQADAVDAVADLIDDALVNAGWLAVIGQFFANGSPLLAGVARVVTEVLLANANLDTQRRRVGR